MPAPTLYQYYSSYGVVHGLSANQSHFTLNNKEITIFSGSLHYFRVPPSYWRDRIQKMKAVGLNTVDTSIPWNLHELEPGKFDFGHGGSDFEQFLNIEKFLRTVQEEDMFAIVRPGPYISANFEFGGLPSWLLRDKGIKLRTSDQKFINHVTRYFKALLTILATLQFTRGGPIIAFEIENEYGSTNSAIAPVDISYMKILKQIISNNRINELLFTSDGPDFGNTSQLQDVLYTGNFQSNPEFELSLMEQFQPGKPLLVMEYWTGWYDHWLNKHNTRSKSDFCDVLERILSYPASVNLYMFHGGSNFGFMNGANILDGSRDNAGIYHVTNSYDYDAPLQENGDYTDKYFDLEDILLKFTKVHTKLHQRPILAARTAYDTIRVDDEILLSNLLQGERFYTSRKLIPMEYLPIGNTGQKYGYTVYKKQHLNIASNSILKIEGRPCDTVMVLIDGQLKSDILKHQKDIFDFGYWKSYNSTLNLGNQKYHDATLELVAENWGRSSFGLLDQFNQYKGLWQGNISINDVNIFDWKIYPLEFQTTWTNSLNRWQETTFTTGPALYKAILNVPTTPQDTYIDMSQWKKGIVIVNGFVLSRYCSLGPQQAVYLPAPFLKLGENEIVIFEHFIPQKTIKFATDMIYKTYT